MSLEIYYQLDSIDIEILKIVNENSTINVNALTELINKNINCSTPTLRVRLIKLMELGFIERLDNHILHSHAKYKIYRINKCFDIDWDIINDFDGFIQDNILNVIGINLLETLKVIIDKKVYSCKRIAAISKIKSSTARARLEKLHELKILEKKKNNESRRNCYCYFIDKKFAKKTIIETLKARKENISY